jgi:hypothetical protein
MNRYIRNLFILPTLIGVTAYPIWMLLDVGQTDAVTVCLSVVGFIWMTFFIRAWIETLRSYFSSIYIRRDEIEGSR